MGFNISVDKIRETELKINYFFPAFYKERIIENNGGELTINGEGWFLFPIYDDSDKKRLKRTFNNISREKEYFDSVYNNLENYIPFANNGSGDYLLFSKVEPNEIFYFFHENLNIKKILLDYNFIFKNK